MKVEASFVNLMKRELKEALSSSEHPFDEVLNLMKRELKVRLRLEVANCFLGQNLMKRELKGVQRPLW